MSGWFAYFTLCASVGTFGVLAFLPVKPIGKGYFRTIGWISLGMAGLCLFMLRFQTYPFIYPILIPQASLHPPREALLPHTADGMIDYGQLGMNDKLNITTAAPMWAACGVIYLLVLLLNHWLYLLRFPAVMAAARIAGLVSGLSLLLIPAHFMHPWFPMLFVLGLLSSAGVLGLAADAMLLGHWYLNVPNLSFRFLKTSSLALCGALLARGSFSGLTIYQGHKGLEGLDCVLRTGFETNFQDFLEDRFSWFILGTRIAVGVVVPLILAVLAWRCAKIHSNQSATGILYVVLFLVIVGEMMGAYLLGRTGLPL